MKKTVVLLLALLLLLSLASAASAQTVACSRGGFSFTVPDAWSSLPLSDGDDPDLCLLLEGGDISLSVYVSLVDGYLPDSLFQVLTGADTETGSLRLEGREISYVFGQDASGYYRIYSWVDEPSQVQLYFLCASSGKSARKTVEKIISSIRFD